MRFAATGGVYRVFFLFDLKRHAILLIAGNNSGVSESRFYRRLIAVADRRYDNHLAMFANKGM